MSFSPTVARQALATQLDGVINSSAQRANIHAFPHGSPNLNAILILPRAGADGLYIDYRQTFGPNSLCRMSLWVEVRVGGDSPSADMEMDRYLTPGSGESIFDAIDVDNTLGGSVGDCTVERGVTPPAWFESGDGTTSRTWLAARFAIDIEESR